MEEEYNEQPEYRNLFLQFPHLDYVKLKEKECRQILHIISKSRLGQKMKHFAYGTFDVDSTGQYGTVVCQAEFSRQTTKSLIWKIADPDKYGYDVLIMVMHKVHELRYYDYLLYNTKTGKCNGHFYKSLDISAPADVSLPTSCIFTDLNISFNRIENSKNMPSDI